VIVLYALASLHVISELSDDDYGTYNFNWGLLPRKPPAPLHDRRR
jgi:hypothetical protein